MSEGNSMLIYVLFMKQALSSSSPRKKFGRLIASKWWDLHVLKKGIFWQLVLFCFENCLHAHNNVNLVNLFLASELSLLQNV